MRATPYARDPPLFFSYKKKSKLDKGSARLIKTLIPKNFNFETTS